MKITKGHLQLQQTPLLFSFCFHIYWQSHTSIFNCRWDDKVEYFFSLKKNINNINNDNTFVFVLYLILQNYLRRFGYVGDDLTSRSAVSNIRSVEDSLERGIKRFQKFANLPMTGRADAVTLAQMAKPRCGVTDIDWAREDVKRKKRYLVHGDPWPRMNLTYRWILGLCDFSWWSVDEVSGFLSEDWNLKRAGNYLVMHLFIWILV